MVRAVAWVGLFSFALAGGCGIDAVGTLGAGTGDAGVPPGADGGSFVPPGAGSDGGTVPPGAGDGGGKVTPQLTWKVAYSPGAIDLTVQGMLDWAEWGVHADGTPVRKATGGARIGTFVLTGSTCNDSDTSGWPVMATWADGTPPDVAGSTAIHRRIYGTDGTTIAISVPCDGTMRELGVDLGGWSSSARFEAAFDNIPLSPPVQDNHGNNSGYHSARYTVDYVCPVGTSVVVRWVATTLPAGAGCSGSDLILSSATLR